MKMPGRQCWLLTDLHCVSFCPVPCLRQPPQPRGPAHTFGPAAPVCRGAPQVPTNTAVCAFFRRAGDNPLPPLLGIPRVLPWPPRSALAPQLQAAESLTQAERPLTSGAARGPKPSAGHCAQGAALRMRHGMLQRRRALFRTIYISIYISLYK